jgi:DNA repair exonuclease SbcCD ATPase subunit
VKRLTAVTIRPDEHGNLVVLSGRNGAGKSSVLDAIAMALGGREQIPAEPIRRGADRAEVVVDLGEIVVRRTFTPSGGGTLVVSNRDGARFQSPQTMLDALVGRLTFDPLAFSREDPRRQAEILRDLVGLDFAGIDAQRQAAYDQRTEANRTAKALSSQIASMPGHPDAPADPVSVAELTEQLQRATAENQRLGKIRAAARQAALQAESRERIAQHTRDEIAKLQRVLDQQERDAAAERSEAEQAASVAAAAGPDIDTAPVLEQLRGAEDVNRKVRENHRRLAIAADHALAEARSGELSDAIKALDQQKADAIAGAAMPVPGIGFAPDGVVTLNALPLEQASAAERIRVSVAIGLAMNPRLRVLLIRDASLLDQDSLRMVADMAREAGAQLWVERVEIDSATTIVIEDGAVFPREAPV